MIMVLSCCDLLAVITNSPLMALITMLRLKGKVDVNTRWANVSSTTSGIFLVFSLFALLVMNFDRYLATSYPIFHRTSVTKGKLLTLLAILIIVEITLKVMSALVESDIFRTYFIPIFSLFSPIFSVFFQKYDYFITIYQIS
jgi:multisubunit Na+/H+ antiporter MnhB subunit